MMTYSDPANPFKAPAPKPVPTATATQMVEWGFTFNSTTHTWSV